MIPAGFFVKDAAERRRFVSEFNAHASSAFQSTSVHTLVVAEIGAGNPDFFHELSAPPIVSGFIVTGKAGMEIPVEDIVKIGTIILSNQVLVRRLFVLHWDTLTVRDARTDKSVSWSIRQFLNYGGMLSIFNNQ